jgi:hypothetical protein
VAAEIEVSETRRLHLPQPAGRFHRPAELSEEDEEVQGEIRTAEAELSSDPANDCHARSKERNAQRHPGTAAAFAAGHDDRCLLQEIPESVKATIEAINRELRNRSQIAEGS